VATGSEHVTTTIGPHHTRLAERDTLLVALTMASGAVDAISYLALGKVFTAFMTGNLVFLGIGVSGTDGPEVGPVSISLIGFATGVLAARRILGDEGRDVWPAPVTTLLELVALLQLAFLGGWLSADGNPGPAGTDVLIALSAAAMGLQSGAVRALNVPGVFTTAATATIIGLMTDVAAPQGTREPARLAGVVVALVVGATSAALLLANVRQLAPVLPLTVTAGVVVAARVGVAR
jgi:uncharacterized membrane protein YoaK (UPF0700 family)